jgi:hypothetical protein
MTTVLFDEAPGPIVPAAIAEDHAVAQLHLSAPRRIGRLRGHSTLTIADINEILSRPDEELTERSDDGELLIRRDLRLIRRRLEGALSEDREQSIIDLARRQNQRGGTP